MSHLARISITLEDDLLTQFDREWQIHGFATRSEAIKSLLREHLNRPAASARGEVAGTITLLFDHHQCGISQSLMRIQHDFTNSIITTLHVHLDHDTCLEVIVVRGMAPEIEELDRALCSVKGLKHHDRILTASHPS